MDGEEDGAVGVGVLDLEAGRIERGGVRVQAEEGRKELQELRHGDQLGRRPQPRGQCIGGQDGRHSRVSPLSLGAKSMAAELMQ